MEPSSLEVTEGGFRTTRASVQVLRKFPLVPAQELSPEPPVLLNNYINNILNLKEREIKYDKYNTYNNNTYVKKRDEITPIISFCYWEFLFHPLTYRNSESYFQIMRKILLQVLRIRVVVYENWKYLRTKFLAFSLVDFRSNLAYEI